MERTYQAREFAELASVTVRTLHHYDRLGLLKPSGRTSAGYRLYTERDLVRLEQVVALKFIGFPLKQIRDLLNRKDIDLRTALGLQRAIISEKRERLALAIKAIERAEQTLAMHETCRQGCGRLSRQAQLDTNSDWEVFRKIIEVIQMQNNTDWMKTYYTAEQLAELGKRWSPGLQAKAERDWADLVKDAEAAIVRGDDPASKNGQALAQRWQTLIEAFTGGAPAIAKSLGQLYADRGNWPSTFKKPYSDEVGRFLCQASDAQKKKS